MIGRHSILAGSSQPCFWPGSERPAASPHERQGDHSSGRQSAVPIVSDPRRCAARRRVVGYSVPAVDGERTMCCFDRTADHVRERRLQRPLCCGRLPSRAFRHRTANRTAQPTAPSGRSSSSFQRHGGAVPHRRAEGRSHQVFSEDCDLDAGGRALANAAFARRTA